VAPKGTWLLPEDGIVWPKHVEAIVNRKIQKYRIQCFLLVILYRNITSDSVHQSLHHYSEKRFRHINEKLEKLDSNTHHKETPDIQFHPRVVNHTDMFTAAETTLLEKGMQYNLHHNLKHKICSLDWEAESAFPNFQNTKDYIRYRVTYAIDALYQRQE
jgi:hypothetical protein